MRIFIAIVLSVLVIRITKKTITTGDTISPVYGAAYTRFDRNVLDRVGICYPIPFNVVIGLLYKLWLKCFRFGVNIHEKEKVK